MAKFKVGDVCVIIKGTSFPELTGTEVTIMGPLMNYENESGSWIGYRTDLIHKTCDICPTEANLRLKEPPKKYKEETRIMELFHKIKQPVVVGEEM